MCIRDRCCIIDLAVNEGSHYPHRQLWIGKSAQGPYLIGGKFWPDLWYIQATISSQAGQQDFIELKHWCLPARTNVTQIAVLKLF